MKDVLILKIKDNQKFILAIIATVLFSLILVFLISSNTGANKEIKKLKVIGTKINKINKSFNEGVKKLSINPTTSADTITKAITELKEIPINLSAINTNYENTKNIKHELIESLSSTIALYDYSIYIISNPQAVISDNNISELISYKDDCLNSYNILSAQGIKISFPHETIVFFENINNYINTVIKENKTQNIINSQKRDFVLSLKNLTPYLNTLTQDLEPALNKIKEDKRDLQVLIDDLNDKETVLKDVKTKLTSTSIPDGYQVYYESLDDFFKLYTPYITAFKTAIIFDKSSVDPIKDKKEINDNYKNVLTKYEDVCNSYSYFKELINNL